MAGRIRQVVSAPLDSETVRVGWVERVSLPELGLWGLAAKVDTGARTAALHVRSVEPVLQDGSLFIVLPPLDGPGDRRLVRVLVQDWIEVRDTSGRRERRPVVETSLEMGPFRRTIRLTLTDRGDMRYPLLVGRTALPRGVLVDPTARFLLRPLRPVAKAIGELRRAARRTQAKI